MFDNKINIYNELLNSIRQCYGSVVQIVYDRDPINQDLIRSFTSDLKIKYKIVDFDELNINTIKVNDNENIFNRKDDKIIKIINEKIVLIVLKNDCITARYSSKLSYSSSLILLLKNKKLKILKSRDLNYDMKNDYIYTEFDINFMLRKMKLKKLNQKNNI